MSLARAVDRIRARALLRGRVGRGPLILALEALAASVARHAEVGAGAGAGSRARAAAGSGFRQDAPSERVGHDDAE